MLDMTSQSVERCRFTNGPWRQRENGQASRDVGSSAIDFPSLIHLVFIQQHSIGSTFILITSFPPLKTSPSGI